MFQINRTYITLFFFLLLAGRCLGQLDAYFSQYMFNGLYVNPAYAGYQTQVQAALYHKKYGNIGSKTPNTSYFSLSAPLRYNQLGVGMQITSDFDGINTRNALSGSIAYKIHFESGILAYGINLGVQQVSFDPNELLIKDQADTQIAKDRINNISPDLGTGFFYQDKKLYAGLSVMHLFQNSLRTQIDNKYVYSLPVHYHLMAGYRAFESGNWSGMGTCLFRFVNTNTYMLDVSFHLKYSDIFWIGTSIKNPWMIGAQTGIKISEWLNPQAGTTIKIGYAFDYALSQFKYRSPSMHEIFVLVDFAPSLSTKKIKNQKIKVSPLFF